MQALVILFAIVWMTVLLAVDNVHCGQRKLFIAATLCDEGLVTSMTLSRSTDFKDRALLFDYYPDF